MPTGTIAGSVHATTTGKPLANVAIAMSPGSITATTAADGTFALSDVPVGVYTMAITRAGYDAKTVGGVGVAYQGTTHVDATLDTDPTTDGPTIVVSDDLVAGFGKSVTLAAAVTDADSDPSTLTYAWTQVSGAPATIAGATTASLTFTTLSLSDAKPSLAPRFGGLGFDPDETGNYVFAFTATDPEGHAASARVLVQATAPGTSLANLPLGVPAYFQGDGAPQATWSWSLDTSLVAGGSGATLDGATTAFPSFTPDKQGTYKLTESVSGKTLTVHGGTWVGVSNAYQGCQSCHDDKTAPDKFTPWLGTKHATTFARGIDGAFGPAFGAECTQCHALGVSPLASNGGFDDVMAKAGWTFPATLQAGNWAQLASAQPQLAALANVQCESCHGPQFSDAHPFDRGARVAWSEATCASCHQEAPNAYAPSQWRASKHADASVAIANATIEARPGGGAADCARCHAAQGFARYAGQLASGVTGVLTTDGKAPSPSNAATDAWLSSIGLTKGTVQPPTCVACHDPHDATNPAQLRIHDAAPGGLPNGQGAIAGAGAGIVCMACHDGSGSPQADVLYGANARFVSGPIPSPHLAVKDVCIGCHFASPTASQTSAHQTSNHSFVADVTICSRCHGAAMDGASLQRTSQAQLDTLDAAIGAKVRSALAAAVTAHGTYVVRAIDPSTGFASKDLALAAAPSSVTRAPPASRHDRAPLRLFTMAAPVTFEVFDAAGTDRGSVTLSTFAVSLDAATSAGAALFPSDGVIAGAIANERLLGDDGSKGVHNAPFFESVVDATNARLVALP